MEKNSGQSLSFFRGELARLLRGLVPCRDQLAAKARATLACRSFDPLRGLRILHPRDTEQPVTGMPAIASAPSLARPNPQAFA